MGQKDETQIELGKKYRDTVTGFEGTAISKHEYLHGCLRVGLQAMSEGGDIKDFMFDAPQLEEVDTGTGFRSRRTGGPRPAPAPRAVGR